MKIEEIFVKGYEKILYGEDAATGLKAIIAVHNTHRGPGVGGTRLYPYASKEEALEDVLRLSEGMTYKSALADITFGGGKSVIIGDPKQKTEALFKAFGKFVESLQGVYLCAEDMNTSPQDMAIVRTETKHVLGLEGQSGDPSPLTALGVFKSIEVTVKHLGLNLQGLKVVVQGVGQVGASVVQRLRKEGATVFIADVNTEKLQTLAAETGAQIIPLEAVYTTPCDVFAPCAMGAILNEKTIKQLTCKAVVGAANNQLATPQDADRLHDRGILYGPDYLVNAGGVINIWFEQLPGGYNAEKAREKVIQISQTLERVYQKSTQENITPAHAANLLAEELFALPMQKTAQS